ncbi:TetR/AcrR family transcriptional regulator [Amycolatopsis pithecellobii]|uniref:TetR/AcrR family transcriptional regulator n=1 Tax=Amycolatopsis pithecellobii TaxID=664692 RepID=UPI0012B86670|nr:TetR/AcrR family transcriptional regulator [Amycolatopsis pithecellobii]
MSESRPHDPYRRRRAAAAASREETRRRLLESADVLFRERGYHQTSVSAIAEHAGFSLQTLYLAWQGGKPALLRAAANAAVTATGLPIEPDIWRHGLVAELAKESGTDPDARATLRALSRMYVRVAHRAAPYWRMLRHAATTDETVAADWKMITGERRRTMRAVIESAAVPGWRPELTTDDIVDTMWALTSPETYDLLTVSRDLSPDEYEAWLARTLQHALCTEAG